MIGLIMLVVFVLYLLVAIAVTSWLARIPKRVPYKWLTALLSLAVFALIPTWDEILGRMYFKHLCETEGGVRVYKTVELAPKYWNENGRPAFITQEGLADKAMLGNRFDFRSASNEYYSKSFNIRKDVELIIEEQRSQVLASYTVYVYFGGWLVTGIWGHVAGESCPAVKDFDYRGFLQSVFTPIGKP